jgi:hypothetical protein
VPTLFAIPVLRLDEDLRPDPEQLAMVSVVQREWGAKNPRASAKDPFTSSSYLSASFDLVEQQRRSKRKIRSAGTVQLPHLHRILLESVLVSRRGIVFEGVGDA